MSTNAMSDNSYTRHRITVDEYYRMAEVGLLAPDARVELIEGEIIDMPPIGSLHAGTLAWLVRQLHGVINDQALVFSQSPARLSNISEPQPDVMLLRPRTDYYSKSHPTARDALLLIEVSFSTLSYDRDIKVPLYASYGVPEVWLIDLENARLTCYRSPHKGTYLEVTSMEAPGSMMLPLGGVRVDLSRVFVLDHSVS